MLSVALPSSRSSERGSASLEFVVAGVVLLVPLVYLIVALSQIQSAVLAAEGGARHAARVFVTAPDGEAALDRAATAVTFAFADEGIDASKVRFEVTCAEGTGAACLERDAVVTVVVRLRLGLPLAPPILGLDEASAVPVEARSSAVVSRFRAGG